MAAHEAGDELRPRRVINLARGPGLFDLAFVHHHDQIGEGHCLFLAVGDVNEGNAEIALEALQFSADPDAQERIERRERLVEKEDRRIGDQRTGQRDTLLLSAGQALTTACDRAEPAEGDELQHLLGPDIAVGLGTCRAS